MTTTTPHAPNLPGAADEARLSFAQRLRETTRDPHQRAEGAQFMHRLLTGDLGLSGYARLAGQHLHIYRALEARGRDLLEDPVAASFIDARLDRVPSLIRDLAHLEGIAGATAANPVPATRAYVERIQEADSDTAFVAHHYIRYLGDLSGGQAIARILARTHDLRVGEPGLLFYHFAELPKPKDYKDTYRARLDAAPWDQRQHQAVIDEARVAYELNSALFADLDTAVASGANGP